MSKLSLNLPIPRGYRRVTPLGLSTLLWLNSCGGMSGQDENSTTQETPPTGVERAPAPTGPAGADTTARISKTALDAAHAVNRHYTEQLMRRRSRTGAPQ
jgi:hypothetical protein